MQGYTSQNRWQQASSNNRAHWGILTLDNLDKTKGKRGQLIAQFQALYLAATEVGKDQPPQTSEDFSI